VPAMDLREGVLCDAELAGASASVRGGPMRRHEVLLVG
jgi:hypothetical protein